ncbi:MAG TPA: threonine synthase [Longimicrobiales bacterium]|nr:threonine synthase [Longimicrobiales bacterium]
MQVCSTRGGEPVPFLEAVDRGLAPDGGLYLPVSWPRLPEPPADLGPALADTAAWAAPLLLDGVLPAAEMAGLARDALDFPVPREPVDERISLLELFHGPTLAFKDVGARFLARLWSRTARRSPRTVLVATSGDTGGAVAQACHGLPGIRVAVLFPAGRVSGMQRRQFTTLGDNVLAVAVDGPFDQCQALAKAALADPGLVTAHGLTSANSINIGRLVPQVFYYLHLARLLGWGRGDGASAPVIVPSGNLGNVTAGVLASRAGAPLGPLVAACNANDALVRYLSDGRTRHVRVVPSLSTAMDVGEPSNLERLVALFGSHDDLKQALAAVSVSDDETRRTIRWGWERGGVHLDPHTAVGVAAALREPWAGGPATVLATAHPAKFARVVAEASGAPVTPHPRLEANRGRPEVKIPLRGGVEELARILEVAFLTRVQRDD